MGLPNPVNFDRAFWRVREQPRAAQRMRDAPCARAALSPAVSARGGILRSSQGAHFIFLPGVRIAPERAGDVRRVP